MKDRLLIPGGVGDRTCRLMQSVQVPELAWYGNTMLNLRFPSEWRVRYCPMNGHARQRIDTDRIRKAFRNPIGSKTIGQLARQKREAIIIFDDTSRPTRAAAIVPHIIEELNANGISNDHIRFVCALGAHGAFNRVDFLKKLDDPIPLKGRRVSRLQSQCILKAN